VNTVFLSLGYFYIFSKLVCSIKNISNRNLKFYSINNQFVIFVPHCPTGATTLFNLLLRLSCDSVQSGINSPNFRRYILPPSSRMTSQNIIGLLFIVIAVINSNPTTLHNYDISTAELKPQ
jgi:hypothetical protein